MYYTQFLSKDNKRFFEAWQKHTPWIAKATFLTQFVKREYSEEYGIRTVKCYFKVWDTDMTICLCALAREREKGEIFSPVHGEIDWRKKPDLGECWWITIKNAYPDFIWYSAEAD